MAVSFAAIFIRWSDAPPLAIAAYRMGIVTIVLLPFALHRSLPEMKGLDRRQAYLMLIVGMVLAAHFFTWTTSVKLTSVASATILVTSHPFIVLIISHFALKESSRIAVPGILLGFLGVVVISYGDIGGSSLAGDALAFAGAFFAAAYIIMGRLLRRTISLITYVFTVYAVCAAALFAACLLVGIPLCPYPPEELVLFAALALVSTILGHTLFNWSLRYLPAYVISVSLLGEPVGATILAALLLSEVPSATVIGGGAMVLTGILMTATFRWRPSTATRDRS